MSAQLDAAIDRLVDIVAAVEAHKRFGRHDAEQLLDRIEADVREVRKLIEALADQDG